MNELNHITNKTNPKYLFIMTLTITVFAIIAHVYINWQHFQMILGFGIPLLSMQLISFYFFRFVLLVSMGFVLFSIYDVYHQLKSNSFLIALILFIVNSLENNISGIRNFRSMLSFLNDGAFSYVRLSMQIIIMVLFILAAVFYREQGKILTMLLIIALVASIIEPIYMTFIFSFHISTFLRTITILPFLCFSIYFKSRNHEVIENS